MSKPPETPLIGAYQVTGKLAVRDGRQGQSFNFSWQQQADHYYVDIWGPLGQGRARLAGTSEYMEIRRGERLLGAGVPADIMQQNLGFSVPVAVMAAWLQGMPRSARAEILEMDTQQRIARFAESGWQVVFDRYPQGSNRPQRIVATRGTYKVTALIRDFQ